MENKKVINRKRVALFFGFAIVCAVALVASLTTRPTAAATPNSGTLKTISGPLFYTSGAFAVSNQTEQVNDVPTCDGTLPCDDYTLSIALALRRVVLPSFTDMKNS